MQLVCISSQGISEEYFIFCLFHVFFWGFFASVPAGLGSPHAGSEWKLNDLSAPKGKTPLASWKDKRLRRRALAWRRKAPDVIISVDGVPLSHAQFYATDFVMMYKKKLFRALGEACEVFLADYEFLHVASLSCCCLNPIYVCSVIPPSSCATHLAKIGWISTLCKSPWCGSKIIVRSVNSESTTDGNDKSIAQKNGLFV